MQRVAFRLALVVSACALSADRATGDVVISNLAGPTQSSTAFGPGTTTIFKAAGWTMPSGDDYFLDDVTLNLDFVSTGSAQVEIWSGVGVPTNPELILNSPPQNGAGNFTFTPPVPFVMEAEGTYWAYVTALPGSDNFNWIASSMAPTGLATNTGYNFNGNPSSFMNKYEVNGTVVPEPASLALFGLLGLAATRRR